MTRPPVERRYPANTKYLRAVVGMVLCSCASMLLITLSFTLSI